MFRSVKGMIFAIDETAMHDGPGLRMTIFLKGCPLRCLWCHSPESISTKQELVWYETKCDHREKCAEVCPEKLRPFESLTSEAQNRCGICRRCVEACPTGALEVKGEVVSAGDIIDKAMQLAPFFRRSGGGITLTGGEPTLQDDFSYAVLYLCHQVGIHTAIETCGYAPWEKFEKLASVCNLFLFDFKHPDAERHREYTGVYNRVILENLGGLIKLGAELVVRVPLIPGCNDSPEVIKAIGYKTMSLGASRISLLPFNPAAPGKYSWQHRVYPLGNVKRQSDEYVNSLEQTLKNEGLKVEN